jgi:hypothetical protein
MNSVVERPPTIHRSTLTSGVRRENDVVLPFALAAGRVEPFPPQQPRIELCADSSETTVRGCREEEEEEEEEEGLELDDDDYYDDDESEGPAFLTEVEEMAQAWNITDRVEVSLGALEMPRVMLRRPCPTTAAANAIKAAGDRKDTGKAGKAAGKAAKEAGKATGTDAQVEIFLMGATVSSWKLPNDSEVLYVRADRRPRFNEPIK